MIKSQRDIYHLIEKVLRESDRPLTCNEIWDKNEDIRKQEPERGANAISDYLGFMWRRGLLIRYPSPRTSTSSARFAYIWKPEKPKNTQSSKRPRQTSRRTDITVTETKDGVIIDVGLVSITVKTR